MSVEAVKEYLASRGFSGRVKEFRTSSATVALAAQALGCTQAHIAKTLAFVLPQGPVLIVTAGDAKVDNAKFRALFGVKAKMIPSEQVQAQIGHAPGGVCPFCLHAGVSVILDESLRRFSVVYPAAGSANSAVCLSPEELAFLCPTSRWADVCKGWQPG